MGPVVTRSDPGPRSASYSHRDEFGQWDPKNQRPELWRLYNSRHRRGEHMRIFPLSNWTELDIWRFVAEKKIDLPPLYFAHDREVFRRDGMLMAVNPFTPMMEGEEAFTAQVRFRTIGDATCTAAVESSAVHVDDIVAETAVARVTERGATRADDRISEAGMEDRKRLGYF
ncbi:MAG: sulfate adenylyltransferase subunit CysD [Ilumatobacteraceae bacterium]